MKVVNLRQAEEYAFKSKEVLATIASQPTPGSRGINADEMRRRCRILNSIEAADGVVMMEDADHAFLVELINGFHFAVAHPDLLAILEAVTNAPEPSTH